jgi:hypothetical protein
MAENTGTGTTGAVDRVRADGLARARRAAHALLNTDLTGAQVTEQALILAEEFAALDRAGRLGT